MRLFYNQERNWGNLYLTIDPQFVLPDSQHLYLFHINAIYRVKSNCQAFAQRVQ